MLTVVAAAAAYLLLTLWAGWKDVGHAFVTLGWSGLAAALSLSLLNYGLRLWRWRLYLSELGHRLPASTAALIYLSGFALTATPGKAGELLRGVFLKQRGIPLTQSTAVFVSERLSDLVAVLLISLPAAAKYPQGKLVVLVAMVAVVFLGLVLSQKAMLSSTLRWSSQYSSRLFRTAQHAIILLQAAALCHRSLLTISATALSIGAWSAEGFAFYLVLNWTGIPLDFWSAMFIFALATLAGALSFLPGGLGGVEAAMVALLLVEGAKQSDAVASTIVIRLTTLWFAVALGVAVLILARRLLTPDQSVSAVAPASRGL
jgi:uncharacterized protein (TIRG00374 family)